MADATENTPSINITRGKKKPPRPQSSTRSSGDASDGWLNLPADLASGAREVWLAGLGALAVVEEQGSKLFRALVEEGQRWEETQRAEAQHALEQAEAQHEETADAARETLNEQVVRRIRDGVDMALERAGVPTRGALNELQAQVDQLAQQADRLAAQLEGDSTDGAE